MTNLTARFELFTDDPKRAVDFYTGILCFEIKYSNERYHSLKRGDVVIGIGSAHKGSFLYRHPIVARG